MMTTYTLLKDKIRMEDGYIVVDYMGTVMDTLILLMA